MTKEITYYFAPISPWTYLGNQRLVDLAKKYEATVIYKPCNILEVFERTGGVPAGQRPKPRQNYRMAELKRWRAYLDVDLNLTPKFFPVPDNLASRLILACENQTDIEKLTQALMTATWAQERDISDEETLLTICEENSLNRSVLIEKAKSEAVISKLAQNTDDAVAADVFGAPTYIYQGENFWGQDRLDFLERALQD